MLPCTYGRVKVRALPARHTATRPLCVDPFVDCDVGCGAIGTREDNGEDNGECGLEVTAVVVGEGTGCGGTPSVTGCGWGVETTLVRGRRVATTGRGT